MIRGIEKLLGYLLIIPAVLPLIFFDGLLYPYVAPKTFLFRSIGIGVLAASLFLLFAGRDVYIERLRQKITWIPGALLLIAYMTSLIGIDFYHSFWSTFDRGDGLITLTVAIVLYYGVVLFAEKDFLTRLMKVSAWVGSLLALHVLLQWLESKTGLNFPLVADPRGRFGGTFGNAAFLAAYLGLTIGATIYTAREYRDTWRIALYAGAAAQLLAILISATRGTLIALILTLGCIVLYHAVRGVGNTKWYARGGLAALMLVVALFVTFRAQLVNVPIASISRLASISSEDGTVSSRLFVWNNILKEAVDRPLTGYGAEHIEVVFNKVYNPAGILEQWFDRSHNAFLDYFVQFGILGFILYVALIVSVLAYGYRLFMTGDMRGVVLVCAALIYGLQNFFVFDTALSLWLFLMFGAGACVALDSAPRTRIFSRRYRLLPETVAIATLALLIPVSILPLRANYLLAQAYLYHMIDVPQAVRAIEKGLALNTYANLEYGYQAYEMYTDRQAVQLTGESREAAYAYTASLLQKNVEDYPYDARSAVYLAHVLDMAPPGVVVADGAMQKAIEQAIVASPLRMQPYYLRANKSIRAADSLKPGAEKIALYQVAIRELEAYARMVPKYAEPRYVLASLNLANGDREIADQWANEALPLYRPNIAVAKRAARYYILTENWALADQFLNEVFSEAEEQQNYPSLYDHAKVKFLSGDREGAEAIVARLKVESRGLVESDPAFMAAIEKGN